ncbi:PaaI family thioesterase [Nocardioidaceae bacterium]|nr:PaaI family thioesterase [Nocardioidaceae bacterium]
MSETTAPDLGAHLGFSAVSESGEGVELEVMPGPEHCNGSGILHGGFLSAVLDSVTGWSVHARDQAAGGSSMWPHVQMNVQYVKAAVPGERLLARGWCRSQGGRIATAEGEVRQGDIVVARATSTHARVAPS